MNTLKPAWRYALRKIGIGIREVDRLASGKNQRKGDGARRAFIVALVKTYEAGSRYARTSMRLELNRAEKSARDAWAYARQIESALNDLKAQHSTLSEICGVQKRNLDKVFAENAALRVQLRVKENPL